MPSEVLIYFAYPNVFCFRKFLEEADLGRAKATIHIANKQKRPVSWRGSMITKVCAATSEESRISKDVEANQIRFNKELEKQDTETNLLSGTNFCPLVGREKHSAFYIMQNCVNLKSIGTRLQIVSAFDVEHVKGFSLEGQSKAGADIVVITREWNSLALLTRKPIKSRPL
ncbi:protein RNA-directed DNA methylation 3, partial [Tanacetum coccineum]